MCLIVDANAAAEFLSSPSAIREWLRGDSDQPRLVASGLLLQELARLANVRQYLVELNRAGKLRSADTDRLRQEEDRLRAGGLCRSNDIHVLSLAIVSGARTLATFDNALAEDFRNPALIRQPRGSIYRDPANHAHLLRHTPPSCGVESAGKRRRRRVK